MKRTRLLNSELSYAISRLGHTDSLTICDAGLPIPPGVKRIDFGHRTRISCVPGHARRSAERDDGRRDGGGQRMRLRNESFFQSIIELFGRHGLQPTITEVPHEEFKRLTHASQVVVRTGEFTPYANLILKSGVVF